MRNQPAPTAFFTTITDVHQKTHVETVFFGSMLEQQLAQGKLREQYPGEEFVIMTYPGPDLANSSEFNDVIYQARMQSLIIGGLQRR